METKWWNVWSGLTLSVHLYCAKPRKFVRLVLVSYTRIFVWLEGTWYPLRERTTNVGRQTCTGQRTSGASRFQLRKREVGGYRNQNERNGSELKSEGLADILDYYPE